MWRDDSFLRRTTLNSIAGTCGGIVICMVGHPFDTLKVRLQTQPSGNPVYKGLGDCFMKTMKWEGIGGLYRGVGKYKSILLVKKGHTGLTRAKRWPISYVITNLAIGEGHD